MSQPTVQPASGFPLKSISSGLRLIALLAFVMPFATVSCGSQDLMTVNGWQAAFGTDYNVMGQAGHTDGIGWFVVALALIVGALVVGLLKARQTQGLLNDRQLNVGAVVMGVGAAVILFIAAASAGSESAGQSGAQPSSFGGVGLTLRWDFGFWLALLGIVLASAVGAASLFPAQFETQVARLGIKTQGSSGFGGGAPRRAPPPTASVAGNLSPDGRHFWNGATWESVESPATPAAPLVGTLSQDGSHFWNGTEWTTVE